MPIAPTSVGRDGGHGATPGPKAALETRQPPSVGTGVPHSKLPQDLTPSGMWLPGLVGILVISSVLGLVVMSASSFPENHEEDRIRAESELSRRIPLIAREIKRLGPSHAWAGEYFRGSALGVRVWLAPDRGCVARWDGCVALSGANWGKVTEHDGVFRVAYERPSEMWGDGPFPRVFRVERDGAETRLIPEGESRDSLRVLVRQ